MHLFCLCVGRFFPFCWRVWLILLLFQKVILRLHQPPLRLAIPRETFICFSLWEDFCLRQLSAPLPPQVLRTSIIRTLTEGLSWQFSSASPSVEGLDLVRIRGPCGCAAAHCGFSFDGWSRCCLSSLLSRCNSWPLEHAHLSFVLRPGGVPETNIRPEMEIPSFSCETVGRSSFFLCLVRQPVISGLIWYLLTAAVLQRSHTKRKFQQSEDAEWICMWASFESACSLREAACLFQILVWPTCWSGSTCWVSPCCLHGQEVGTPWQGWSNKVWGQSRQFTYPPEVCCWTVEGSWSTCREPMWTRQEHANSQNTENPPGPLTFWLWGKYPPPWQPCFHNCWGLLLF